LNQHGLAAYVDLLRLKYKRADSFNKPALLLDVARPRGFKLLTT